MSDFKKILDGIGESAALEQLAEECCELGQAALKLARKNRGENPTPVSTQEGIEQVLEETADVMLCMTVLMGTDWFDAEKVDLTIDSKMKRWIERIIEHGKSRNNIDKPDI